MSAPLPYARSYWVVQDRFLAGCYPGDADAAAADAKLEALLDAGIDTFINLMEVEEKDWEGRHFRPYDGRVQELAARQGRQVTCHRFPIRDHTAPDTARMDDILETIDAVHAKGGAVYIHCWGGKGRTGTVVGCYLIRKGLATPENFVEVIKQLRGLDARTGPSPENEEQIGFVRSYTAQA